MQNQLAQKIFKHYEDNADSFRPHLGASMGGEPCLRKLWYSFRHTMPVFHEGRMLRLFMRGHREEEFFIEDLEGIGFNIKAEDENGKQYRFTSPENAHIGGSGDGFFQAPVDIDIIPAGAWGITEFKTYNKSSFAKLIKTKSVKLTKPLHYSQMNLYMGWAGCQWAIYMAVCKDNDDLYIEVLQFDQDEYHRVQSNMIGVVKTNQPPPPLHTDRSRFDCKYCDFSAPCYTDTFPLNISCRTCVYASALPNGKWACNRVKGEPTPESRGFDSAVGCHEHLVIPELLQNLAVPSAASGPEEKSQYIVYTSIDDNSKTFINGGPNGYSSNDIAKFVAVDPKGLFNESTKHLVEEFDAKVLEVQSNG